MFVKISEQPSLYNDLEKKSVREILEDINTEDQKVALAVQRAIPQIEKLVTQIVPRMKQGGRIFYMGAGTSGRLGVLDASEIPPTFGMPPTLVIGLIAGGDTALRNPVENAEDDIHRGWEELTERNITDKDTVIGIAASGTTPYVIGAMHEAREHGILTGCITSNPDSPMEAGGESFGVLGSGADICYPKSNEKLYRMCMERGGILSTYLPGTPPTPNLFPPRNRIISGLSDGILIIEAREKSGTIITADLALEQGKDVFVIPGRVTDRLSDGCNSLIRQGASLIQSPEQLLEELHIGYGKVPVTGYEEEENPYEQGKESGKVQSDNRETFSQFTLEEQAFLQLFDLELLSIEQIRRKMVANSFLKNITIPQTMEMLMKFVIMGQLRAEGGYYAKMMSGIGDVGVGDDDGLSAGVLDGRVAPSDVLDHARHAADLDIVAGLDDAHKGHLHAADKV